MTPTRAIILVARSVGYILAPVILAIGFFGNRLRDGGPFTSEDLAWIFVIVTFTVVVNGIAWALAKRMLGLSNGAS